MLAPACISTDHPRFLSFVPAAGTKRVRWDRKTIDAALKSGFQQAFDDTKQRGVAGFIIGNILEVVLGAPLDYFLDRSD